MPRPRARDPEAEATRLLLTGLSGVRQEDIRGYALIVIKADGEGEFAGSFCCGYHGLAATAAIAAHHRDRLTPCSGEIP